MLNEGKVEILCLTCRYWQADRAKKKGICKRYAPRPGDESIWPPTLYNDWCGEHRAVYEPAYADKEQIEKQGVGIIDVNFAGTSEDVSGTNMLWGEEE